MSTRWLVGLLSFGLCFGLAFGAETKKDEKKDEKKEEKKKEEKKEAKKPVTLPEAVTKAIQSRCKDAEVLSAKEKKEGDKVVAYEAKVKGKCGECKMVLAADGKLLETGKCPVAPDALPAPVAEAVKKWAPAAKVVKAEVQTKKETGTAYKVEADLNGKILKAQIAEDGKVIKADDLPKPKEEKKKEEKKEPKKEEKKKEEKKEEKK
jgi:hypothetical protein